MRRLLRVPWTARRSYQFSLKEISPESSLEGLTLKLKTPKLWPPDAKNWLIRKDPDAGKDWMQEKGMIEDEMVGWRHWLNGHEFEQALRVGDGREAWRAAVHGVAKGRTRLSNWSDLTEASPFLWPWPTFQMATTFSFEPCWNVTLLQDFPYIVGDAWDLYLPCTLLDKHERLSDQLCQNIQVQCLHQVTSSSLWCSTCLSITWIPHIEVIPHIKVICDGHGCGRHG